MSRKTFTALFIAGIVLRIAGIWIPQLWYDENFSLLLARLPFDRMMIATMGDVHPPLWYIVEWLFVRLWQNPQLAPAWSLRIPAMIFSVLSLLAFRELLNELWISERIQPIAMTLMVFLPFQIWYAQEARMYSLLELEVMLALLFALRRQWIELFIVSLAMLYTQNYSMFYLACVGLVILIKDVNFITYQREMGDWFGWWKTFEPTLNTATAMLCAFVMYLPWVKVLSTQMAYIGGRYWIQTPGAGDVLYTVYRLFWGSSMPSFALISAMVVTFMALSLGILHIFRDDDVERWTITIMAFGPLVLAFIGSLLWNPILLYRALIGSSPFLYILIAWPAKALIESVTRRSQPGPVLSREQVLAAALIIPILFSGTAGYYKNIPAMKNEGAVSSLLDALQYIKAHWQEGDVIYYTDDGPMINLLPYAGDLPQYGMKVCGMDAYGLVLGSLNPHTRQAIGIEVRDLDQIPHKRAWVLAPVSPLHPKCYEEQIKPITQGKPVITVDDNVFIFSGVWLVEAQ